MGKRVEADIDEPPIKKPKKVKELVDAVAQDIEPEAPKSEKKKKKSEQIDMAETAEDADQERMKKKEEKRKRKQAAADAAAEEAALEQAPTKKRKTDATAEEAPADEEKELIEEIFVGGLPFSCTEGPLREYFSKCGEVQSLKLPAGKGTKKHSRGIAFITFSSKKGVRKALKLNGADYEGRTLRVSCDKRPEKAVQVQSDTETSNGKKREKDFLVQSDKGNSKGKGDSALRVFVGGLPFKATESILRKDFGECGEIESFIMPLNEEGRPRGIAFIGYKTQQGFDNALAFDGTEYGGRMLMVSKAVKGKDCKGKAKGKGKDKES